MVASPVLSELNDSLTLPVIIAPMFLISGPDLVIAAAKSGLISCFPAANARTIDDLSSWLTRISSEVEEAGKPGQWGINMIVHKSYDRFEEEMSLIEQHKPKFVVTALGSPKRVLERVHGFGGYVFCDVISVEHAKKAVEAGVDGLILVCSGAGGHTGEYSPLAFVQEVRKFWDGPLIVGGAVSNARSIQAVLSLGADFAYMGTRFISCPESQVTDENREMLVRAEMSDIVTTAAVSGVKANWMKESLEKVGFDFDQLDAKAKIDFSNIQGENKAWKHTWGAGQGVGNTHSVQTVEEVVEELKAEWTGLRKKQINTIEFWAEKA